MLCFEDQALKKNIEKEQHKVYCLSEYFFFSIKMDIYHRMSQSPIYNSLFPHDKSLHK